MRGKKITKAVIPAAGKGTRLLPLTRAIPKEMVPLGRKPVLEHIIEETAASGITEVLFVISEEKEAIRAYFGESMHGVHFEYTVQLEQKGLADAIYCGREFADGEPFAVVLGDSVIETPNTLLPFRRVIETYEGTDAGAVIVVEKTPLSQVYRYGIVKPTHQVAPSFPICGLVEKPKPEHAPSQYAIAGRYVFDADIFDYIERTLRGAGGEYQITDTVQMMLDDGREVWCVALGEGEVRRDIGTFEAYFEAFEREIEKERSGG